MNTFRVFLHYKCQSNLINIRAKSLGDIIRAFPNAEVELRAQGIHFVPEIEVSNGLIIPL